MAIQQLINQALGTAASLKAFNDKKQAAKIKEASEDFKPVNWTQGPEAIEQSQYPYNVQDVYQGMDQYQSTVQEQAKPLFDVTKAEQALLRSNMVRSNAIRQKKFGSFRRKK